MDARRTDMPVSRSDLVDAFFDAWCEDPPPTDEDRLLIRREIDSELKRLRDASDVDFVDYVIEVFDVPHEMRVELIDALR